jgi:two-component system, LytTR family, sensor kinase
VSRKRKYWIISTVWVLMLALQVGQDWLNSQLLDTDFFWEESFHFNVKWLFYIPITFVLMALHDRFPLEGPSLPRHVGYLIVITLLVVGVHLLSFGWLLQALWEYVRQRPVSLMGIYRKLFSLYFINVWVIYWVILLAYRAYQVSVGYQQAKVEQERLQKQLADSKLQALKMQLQPHFLFNTHHNIIGLMQAGDTQRATQMLMKLSDLLRLSLRENLGNLVPLRNEIRLLQLYLDILKVRFGERLQYQIDIQKEAEQALVPPMLLQPIVENAVKYGVEPFAKTGEIKVWIGRQGANLKLDVCDNGIESQTVAGFDFGVGLSNTQERLANLFGDDALLNICTNEPHRGITVSIQLPFLTQEP